jgi:hypothetical protein
MNVPILAVGRNSDVVTIAFKRIEGASKRRAYARAGLGASELLAVAKRCVGPPFGLAAGFLEPG